MLEISLRQLETFVVTAECASFTRAAEKLHLTQSTVSTHIQSLEEELDTQLILRGARRKLELTNTGRQVYSAAKEIINRCEALETMRENSGAATLNIATSTVPAQRLIPKLMTGYLKKNSAARFAVKRGDSDQVRHMLEKGEARIGFMGVQPDPKRFTSHQIAMDTLAVITENSNRFRQLKQQGTTGLQLILEEPMIAREESSGTQQTAETFLISTGMDISELKIIARMDSPEAVKAAVAQGMGVSVMSFLAAQEEVISGRLIAFDITETKANRPLYIAWRKDTSLTATEQKFVSYVRTETPKLVQ